MQPFILLSALFAVLVAYFELGPQSQQAASYEPSITRVVRDLPFRPTTAQTIESTTAEHTDHRHTLTHVVSKPKASLNLELPSIQHAPFSPQAHKIKIRNLFEEQGAEKISYNAELVFDSKKGEDVTGGKVNIRIPLS